MEFFFTFLVFPSKEKRNKKQKSLIKENNSNLHIFY